jgi:hypothetical protein
MGFTLKPAYGRDYATPQQVLAAFDEGMDFVVADEGQWSGKYINKPQLEGLQVDSVAVRHDASTKIVTLERDSRGHWRHTR